MNGDRNQNYIRGLVRELRSLPRETDWVEFKVGQREPHMIGEYISALANAAALHGRPHTYMLWGIEDKTHEVVGTVFSPAASKKGNEPLETWLLRLLNPRIDFRFYECIIDERKVVLLEIDRATQRPVSFNGVEYIRVGASTRKLKDYPEKERVLWRVFDQVRFEDGIASARLNDEDILCNLDYPQYFNLLDRPLPDSRASILDALARDRLIKPSSAGGFDITNLGAILFAKEIEGFPRLARKALRIVRYQGTDRLNAFGEKQGTKGYAAGFEEFVNFINAQLPTREVVEQALRRSVSEFPELAVRELVVNALIHQDFSIVGAGPMVEIFENRIEVTNPGKPLIDTQRFLDSPPNSRNETLASLMRRFGICEERGSGIDKVIFQVELHQMPAPLFETPEGFTRITLFAQKSLADMDQNDRVRACYLHACLQYVNHRRMTNSSLRNRFGISRKNASMVSRILGDVVEAGLIVVANPEAGTRDRHYFPFWANLDEVA